MANALKVNNIQGPLGVVFHKKVKQVRHDLRRWNWTDVGNIHDKFNSFQKKVSDLEGGLQVRW